MTHAATPADLRHGTPVSTRSDRYGLDKHVFPAGADWPDGLELFIYDDGRVKIAGWHTAVTVEAVRIFASATGSDSRGGCHVIARFTAAVPAPDAVPELDRADGELRTYLIGRVRGANRGDPDAAKVTYRGAAAAMPAGGWKYPRYTGIGQALDRINRYEHAHGRPLLSVLVVHKEGRQQHPAPPPGGVAPAWISVVPPDRPAGQLPVPTVADLAALALRRCYERLEAGDAAVPVQDALAAMRLAWQVERDQAIPERDVALRQLEKWQQDITEFTWALRMVLDRQYPGAWPAVMTEVRKHCSPAPR